MADKPTPEDLAGTSARGKAAYAARQATLRRLGITPKEPSVYDLDPDADAAVDAVSFDAELRDIERADLAAQRQLEADGWISRDEERRRIH
jgi:hypothetical protein